MSESDAKRLVERVAHRDRQWHVFDEATRAAVCILETFRGCDIPMTELSADVRAAMVDDWALIIREVLEVK